jgi:trimeric autotransporter adhesin
MNSLQFAYLNGLLADASYVTPIKLGEIDAADFGARLTQTQANFLAANFNVKSRVETPNTINPLLGTGFDAVVWEGKGGTPYAGQVYVSMRGTAGGTDIADDVSLATKGLPYDQIRDMVNWWLRSTASTSDNNVVQIKVVDLPGQVIGRTFALDTPTTGTGALNGLGPITAVNGHSLGGYLSTVFTRLFGADVQAVNTFNSAGFSNVMSTNIQGELLNVANMIGASRGRGSLDAVSPIQTNFYAENGIEVTTNSLADIRLPGFSQYGRRIALHQESLLGGDPVSNHYMYKLTDYLAVGSAMAALDPTLDAERLNQVVKFGSNLTEGSYEGVLDGLRRFFFGLGVTPLQISDAANSPSPRVTFHQELELMMESEAFEALRGQITLGVANAGLVNTAKTDFGAFLSLLGLSPILLSTGGSASAASALQAVHPSLYADWNADRNARLYGDESYEYSYSEQWYADRSSMLSLMLARNEVDGNGHFTMRHLPQDLRLWDLDSGTKLYLNNSSNEGPATETYPKQHITFGTAQADLMVGDAYADRLYGGGGLDQLNGGDGRDYLEGGAGSDWLYGERGNDTLRGGADGDWLEGGEGHDSLIGGSGIDTYRFAGSFGRDTIVDSDGQGVLSFESGVLSGGQRVAGGAAQWISSDGLTTFTLLPQSAGAQDLLISRRSGPGSAAMAGTIAVRNWTNGQLGITLQEAPPAPPPANTLISGFVKAANPLTGVYERAGENYVSAGADPTAQDLVFGSAVADLQNSGAGNDALIGDAGDDVLHGEEGSDVLLGGSGRDMLYGGAGNDFIHGSGLSTGFSGPTSVSSPPPSSSGVELARGFYARGV